MPIRTKPWAIDGNTHPGQDIRIAAAAGLGCNQTASFTGGVPAAAGLLVDPGHGVTGPTDYKVTQNGTPNMSVNVAAGVAMIRGTQSALQGVYEGVANDGTVNLTIAAANATNPRRDLVLLQVRDNAFDAGGINDARLVVVTGTPAASPVDPSLTSFPNALVLARVTVAANATSITNAAITDLRSVAGDWFRPRGLMGRTQLLSSHGSISALTDVSFGGTPLAVTFTALANRLYRADVQVRCDQASATAAVEISIRDNAGTVLAKTTATQAAGETQTHTPRTFPATVTAGSYTFKVSAQAAGGGTVTAFGAATQPMFIEVEDVGGVLA